MNTIDNAARRAVMAKGALAGAALGLGALLKDDHAHAAGSITKGDVAILQFLLVAEAVETDLWQQYTELVTNNPAYRDALGETDPSLMQYITDTERDERSHADFIRAYLASIGVAPVDLSQFVALPPPPVSGLAQTPRLTNLTCLTVDTSWYARYRTAANPDFGDQPPQVATIASRPTIPTSDGMSPDEIRAAAEAASFHFAAIEQGGASLYAQFVPKATNLDVLRIVAGIGPVEAIHFGVFQTALEGVGGVSAEDGSLAVPSLRNNALQSESVMPAPCPFLNPRLPANSVVRPTGTAKAGAVAAATGLVASGLFAGQPKEFFDAVTALAAAADAATRRAI